jgi:hypothetical protein
VLRIWGTSSTTAFCAETTCDRLSLHLERAECLCEDGSCPTLALKSVADAVRALRRHVDMVPWRDREQEAA